MPTLQLNREQNLVEARRQIRQQFRDGRLTADEARVQLQWVDEAAASGRIVLAVADFDMRPAQRRQHKNVA